MKRSLLSIGMWMFACAMACAQACVPGGGVTCTSNINLWIIPANYLNWNVPVDDNTQLIDNWSATVLPKAGGTMTGNLILNADPTTSLQAATKHYVDTLANSFTLGATVINLGTTTTTVTGLTLDGVTPTVFGYLDATSSIQTQLNAQGRERRQHRHHFAEWADDTDHGQPGRLRNTRDRLYLWERDGELHVFDNGSSRKRDGRGAPRQPDLYRSASRADSRESR